MKGSACEDLRAMKFEGGYGYFGLGIRSQSGFGLTGDPEPTEAAVSGRACTSLTRLLARAARQPQLRRYVYQSL